MAAVLRRGFAVLVGFSAAGAGLACGPSFQAIYEGNTRFEHCYALEENPAAPMTQKSDCWRDWSERYTYGQTRDRIQYAIARYVALSQAPNIPTDEAMMMAAPGVTPRVSTITAPTPTNAFAPPPKVLEVDAAVSPPVRPTDKPLVVAIADAAPPAPAPPPLPAHTCSDGCRGSYEKCNVGCDGGKACPACEKTYKTCMRGCFK